MKTTVKVSIGSWSFTLEQSAFEWLDSYLKVYENAHPGQSEKLESELGDYLNSRQYADNRTVDRSTLEEVLSALGYTLEPEPQPEKRRKKSSGNETPWWRNTRLHRSRQNRVIGGVLGGLSESLGVDPILLRTGLAALLLVSMCAEWMLFPLLILIYLLWMVIVPRQNDTVGYVPLQNRVENAAKDVETSPFIKVLADVMKVFFGILFLLLGVVGLVAVLLIPFAHTFAFLNNGLLSYLPVPGSWKVVRWLIALLLLLPSVGFVYEGIRLLFRLPSGRVHFGLILFLLWIAVLAATSVLVVKDALQFHHNDVVYSTALPATGDTLTIVVDEGGLAAPMNAVFFDDMYFLWMPDAEKPMGAVLPYVKLHRSNNAEPRMKLHWEGFSRREETSQSLCRYFTATDSTLMLHPAFFSPSDPCFMTDTRLDLYVDKNQVVMMSYGGQCYRLDMGKPYYPYTGQRNEEKCCSVVSVDVY